MSLVDVLDFLAVVLNVILLTVYFYNFSSERVTGGISKNNSSNIGLYAVEYHLAGKFSF